MMNTDMTILMWVILSVTFPIWIPLVRAIYRRLLSNPKPKEKVWNTPKHRPLRAEPLEQGQYSQKPIPDNPPAQIPTPRVKKLRVQTTPLSPNMPKGSHTVYWIRPKGLQRGDALTQGYIGVTHSFAKRVNEHAQGIDSNKMIQAHIKHGEEIVISPICHTHKCRAYELESMLRPATNIGWNVRQGGEHSSEPSKEDYAVFRTKLNHAPKTSHIDQLTYGY